MSPTHTGEGQRELVLLWLDVHLACLSERLCYPSKPSSTLVDGLRRRNKLRVKWSLQQL